MHGLLPEKPGAQRIFDDAELVEDHSYGQVLHKHFKPHVVCRPCNNDWMSGLETAAELILRPLMLGKATHLDRRSQTILATWACMKNMVAEFSSPETRATDTAGLERMRRKQLPPRRERPSGLDGTRDLSGPPATYPEGCASRTDLCSPVTILR